jgi:hypothetical protein
MSSYFSMCYVPFCAVEIVHMLDCEQGTDGKEIIKQLHPPAEIRPSQSDVDLA